MDVGLAVIFQGTDESRSDYEVYKSELRLGSMAEELGFDSIWGVEHHFTEYTMCPDVVQFLTYFAAKSKTLKLGSMVIVLPWHHPMRVAEEVSMLDAMSDGRMILGLGRGLGRVEFGGFGVDMNASREMFVEYAEMILEGLENGYCEYDGKHIQQERRDIRPRPHQTFKGRTYAAAVSPESSRIMAKLGIGILIIPQKDWAEVEKELNDYRKIYREENGTEAPPPIMAGWTYCDKDKGKAEDMARKYIGGYWMTAMKHYEMLSDHFKDTKGYESYAQLHEAVSAEGGVQNMIDFFMSIQIWGTPEMCYEKILDRRNRIGADYFTGVFSFAGMPYDDAEKSMKLFASDVLPELKKLGPAAEERKAAAE